MKVVKACCSQYTIYIYNFISFYIKSYGMSLKMTMVKTYKPKKKMQILLIKQYIFFLNIINSIYMQVWKYKFLPQRRVVYF